MKHFARQLVIVAATALFPVSLLLTTGCQSTTKSTTDAPASFSGATAPQAASTVPSTPSAAPAPLTTTLTNSESIVLQPGDTIKVTFPGAASLDRVVVIRRDGRVTLPQIGEFKAAGLTPKEVESQLLELYGPLLQTKEVSVSVESSIFPVYVTGAVLRPGKILSDRPLTALEAIMEAGGFDYSKANLKAVRVLRTQGGHTQHYTVNLKRVLQAQGEEQFEIRPSDIIYVPEKFNIF